jgi:addiction module RelE/StbE family toxin
MPRKKFKIEYLSAADRDLTEIFSYIAFDSATPQAAANLLEKIDQAVKTLEMFPYAHPVHHSPELRSVPFEFRVLVVASYLVFYYVTGNTITIARVVYGKRDIGNVLPAT